MKDEPKAACLLSASVFLMSVYFSETLLHVNTKTCVIQCTVHRDYGIVYCTMVDRCGIQQAFHVVNIINEHAP